MLFTPKFWEKVGMVFMIATCGCVVVAAAAAGMALALWIWTMVGS